MKNAKKSKKTCETSRALRSASAAKQRKPKLVRMIEGNIPLDSYKLERALDADGNIVGLMLFTYINPSQVDFLPVKIKMEAAMLVHELSKNQTQH